jgi:acetyl-CoA carboxylase carboxyltransferase component
VARPDPAQTPGMSETQTRVELQRALEAALGGGPERHHQKTAEQGKLPVRERIQLLVDPESFAEEALLANWEQEGLGRAGRHSRPPRSAD